MDQVVAKIRKSATSEVWVVITEYTGQKRLDIREYFLAGEGKGFLPTKKGVSFPLSAVRALRDAIESLIGATEIGTFESFLKSERSEVRAGLRSYLGHTYTEFRVYIPGDNPETEWRPTPRGFTLNPSLMHLLAEAVDDAEDLL